MFKLSIKPRRIECCFYHEKDHPLCMSIPGLCQWHLGKIFGLIERRDDERGDWVLAAKKKKIINIDQFFSKMISCGLWKLLVNILRTVKKT